MKNSHTLLLCAAVIGLCPNVAKAMSSNRIASTIQSNAQKNNDHQQNSEQLTEAQRMQEYVSEYRRTLAFPDMSEEDSKKFVNALENANMNDAIESLNNLLHHKQVPLNEQDLLFLKEITHDIKSYEEGLPRLAKSLLRDRKDLSSYPEYQPYLNHLERYNNNLNYFHTKNKTMQDEYQMHSDIRKKAIRIEFYRDRKELAKDYEKLHKFGK